jgi:hypothetical protein
LCFTKYSYIYRLTIALRKTVAILLLILLVFNIIGYRAWFYFAGKQADSHMEALLDNEQYDEHNLVRLELPLHLPYLHEQSDFERVSGEITFNGRVYKYVKRKVSNSNLILLCIPDERKTAINQGKLQYGSYANDIGTVPTGRETSHPASHAAPSFSDYESFIYSLSIPGCSSVHIKASGRHAAALADCYLDAPGKPPRFRA